MVAPVLALILTRPKAASHRFWDSLDPAVRAQLNPVVSPVLCIVPTGEPVRVGAARGLIVTSANAIEAAVPPQAGLPCFCVGAATTRAARDAGWDARQVGQDANSLIAALLAERPDAPLLHLRGRHTRGNVAAQLNAGGLGCAEQVIYDQVAVPLSPAALAALSGPAILAVFSPRSAELIADQLPQGAKPQIAALSAAVAAPFSALPDAYVHVCAQPDADAMRHLVEKLANYGIRVEGDRTAH